MMVTRRMFTTELGGCLQRITHMYHYQVIASIT
jgi:hypothetical protein